MKFGDDSGLSEVVDSTLIIALGIVLAVVIAVFVFGVFIPVEKTAYVVPRFGISNESGHSFVTIFNRGGDPVGFLNESTARYRADVYLDTADGVFRALPDPGLPVFRPGDTVYIFFTGSGFFLTGNGTGTAYPPLPGGRISIRLVDATSGVLIAAENLVPQPGIPGGTMTATTSVTVTPTATGTLLTAVTTAQPAPSVTTALPTTLATTTTGTTTTIPTTQATTTTAATPAPTPTLTATPATYTLTVSWSPWGLGTVSPPGGNSGAAVAITVPQGSGQVFVATPVQHKAVRSIVVDGSTIYAGSAAATPVTFTFSNIVSDHTVAVLFG